MDRDGYIQRYIQRNEKDITTERIKYVNVETDRNRSKQIETDETKYIEKKQMRKTENTHSQSGYQPQKECE